MNISIHALAKRATGDYDEKLMAVEAISIHALAKRATNSLGTSKEYRYISIHALAKRAT